MKLLKSMTTSYELSLWLKEPGVEQTGGEYYWVLTDECEAYCYHHSDSMCNTSNGYTILCRAFTLGELVRELPECRIEKFTDKLGVVFTAQIVMHPLIYESRISPEEAAGELYYEILKSKL